MPKIVINRCYGGFSISEAAVLAYAARKGLTLYPEVDNGAFHITSYWTIPETDERRAAYVGGGKPFYALTSEQRIANNKVYRDHTIGIRDIPRDDPDLVAVVEELGDAADGSCASLQVVEIPDGVEWEIEEHDGMEHAVEAHRTWS